MAEDTGEQQLSIEAADRSGLRRLIRAICADRPEAYLLLDVSKGDRPSGALAVVLSGASAAARRTFCRALADVLRADVGLATAEGRPPEEFVQQCLDLAETFVSQSTSTELNDLQTALSALCESELSVQSSAARVLSYFGTVESVASISKIYESHGHSLELAAYLLSARSRLDPLTAFDFPFAHGASELPNGFVLAAQDAIWAMFTFSAHLAKSKIVELANSWPPQFVSLIVEILEDAPLSGDSSAGAALRLISDADRASSVGLPPVGVFARVYRRGRLNVLPGFSMSAAGSIRQFEPQREAWMEAVADRLSRIVASAYPNAPIKEPNWVNWPRGEAWSTIFKRLRISSEAAFGLAKTSDVCFEMFYLSRNRSTDYNIVEFGHLETFSVLFDRRNEAISDYFRSAELGTSLQKAAADWKTQSPRHEQFILTPNYSYADDMIQDELIIPELWPALESGRYDTPADLFERLKDKPQNIAVICDNVTANDVLSRVGGVALKVEQKHLPYPNPVPFGLAFDAQDDRWGQALADALAAVLVDGKSELRHSLLKLSSEIKAIRGVPSVLLAKVFLLGVGG